MELQPSYLSVQYDNYFYVEIYLGEYTTYLGNDLESWNLNYNKNIYFIYS